MICGIGIDSVAIKRFDSWQYFSVSQLLKVFSPQELEYCFAHQKKMAERLAVRFAAKEAFYKAGSGYFFQKPLYAILKTVSVCHDPDKRAYLAIKWEELVGDQGLEHTKNIRVHLSLTHTKDLATAFVIIEQEKNIS
jgi:holo-[acyl-carrier protein] synthase